MRQVKRSHINPRYTQDKFDINKQLYSNLYQIDPIKLIPKGKHAILEQQYGKSWKQEIIAKFRNIESELHNDMYKQLGNIEASSDKDQRLSGLANIIPFGHKKLKKNDFKELHDKVISGGFKNEKNPTMLCSEFVATTIAVSIVELDKQIKQDLKENKFIKISGYNLENDIIKVPFSKHENLHKIHPDRLISCMKNCIKRVHTKSTEYIKEDAIRYVLTGLVAVLTRILHKVGINDAEYLL